MSSEPLVDASSSAILKTTFSGDVRPLEQASARSEAIISKTASRLNEIMMRSADPFDRMSNAAMQSATVVSAQMQSMSSAAGSAIAQIASSATGVESGFNKVGSSAATNFGTVNTATQSSLQYINQWGDGISTSVRKFTSEMLTVPPAFTAVSQGASQAGQSTAVAMNSAGAAIGSVGVAASQAAGQVAPLGAAAQNMGQSVQSATTAANTGFNSMAGAVGSASQRLGQIQGEIGRVNQIIQEETAILNSQRGSFEQAFGSGAQGIAAQYAARIKETESRLGEALVTKAKLGQEANKLSGSLTETGGAFDRLTTRVSVGRGLLSGYDGAVEALVRSIGGIPVGVSVAIGLLSTFGSVLLSNKKAKEETVAVTKVLIENDILLAAAFDRLASSGFNANTAIAGQAESFRKLLQIDLFAQLVQIGQAYEQVEQKSKEATLAQDAYKETQANLAIWADILAGKREAEGQQLDRIRTRYETGQHAIEQQREAVATLDAQREKAEGTLNKHIDTLGVMGDLTNRTSQELLAEAQSANVAAGAIARITVQLDGATKAANAFANALNNLKLAGPDVIATSQGLATANTTLRDALDGTRKKILESAGASASLTQQQYAAEQAFRAQLPALKQVAEAEINYRLQSSILAGETKKKSQIEKEYRATLAQSSSEVSQAKLRALELGDALEKASEKTRKAGGAASAARPMLNEFAVGLLGIEKAAQVVLSRMGDADLFGNVTKKNRASIAEFKAASKELADAAEEMFRSMGVKVKVNAEQIATLGKDLAKPFLQQVLAFKTLQGAIDNLNFQRAAGQVALLDNELKINGKTIELSITTYNALSQAVVSNLSKMGFTFKTVFPAANAEIVDFTEMLKAANVASRDFTQETQNDFKAWGDAVTRELERVSAEAPSYSDGLIEAAKRTKDAIDNSVPVAIVNAQLQVQQSITSMIGDLEQLATNLGLQGEAWEQYVQGGIRQNLEAANATLKEHEKLSAETIERIVEKWRKELVKLPGIWDEVFRDASASTRKNVDDILRIIDLIPGRVGDSLRKTESEFRRWYEMIDRTIRLIERALGEKETEGLSGVISKVGELLGGIFKKAQAQTKSDADKWTEDIAGVLGSMSGEAGEAGGKSGESFSQGFLGQVGLIASGLATFFGTRGQGRLVGILGGAQAGAQIGSAFAPGIGTAIGAGIGAIVGGLFGTGGPSEEEKRRAEEQRKLEIERIRQDLAKGYQELQQAVLETATRAHALLESIIGRARVPKAEIQGFVKDMTRLLRMLVKELATIPKEVTEEIRVISENLLPSAELMAAMPQVFEGINQHMPMAESQARLYVNDWGLLVNLIGELAEDTPNKLEKQIKKFSTRLLPSAELLITTSEGMNAVFKTRPVSAANFKTWAGNIDIILVELTALEEKFDRYSVRKAGVFAENAQKTFGLLTEGSAAINSVGDIAVITASDLAPFSNGINLIIVTVSDLSRSVNSVLVAESQRFSQGAGASVTFMLETAQGFQELKNIETVIPDTLRAVGEGVKLAVVIMAGIAREVDQEMRDDAEGLATSIGSVFTVVTNAAQAFSTASTTRTLYPATMRAIGDGVQLAVVELARVSRVVGTEMAAEANTFATSVGAVFTLISSAGAAGRDLDPEDLNLNGLIMLIGNIEEATVRVIDLAKRTDKNDLALAVEFSDNANKIFIATAAGIDIQKNMAGLEPVSISQWDNFVLNVSQQTVALARSVEVTRQGLDLSVEFRRNTDGIRENVEAALANILATASAAAGYLANSASYSFSIVSQGLQASSLPSTGETGGTSASSSYMPHSGGETHIHYHETVEVYIEGSLIAERNAGDFVEQVLERRRQRGGRESR